MAEHIIGRAGEHLLLNDVQVPEIRRLHHWFKSHVQKALAALVQEINRRESHPIREALQATLRSIIVRVSNQETDTRYAAVVKDFSGCHVFDQFLRAAGRRPLKLGLSDSWMAGPSLPMFLS